MDKTKEKMLFSEMTFNAPDRNAILNKHKLLEQINTAFQQTSTRELREKVFRLNDQLSSFAKDKNGLWNIDSNGDTVKINQKFLANELKQVVEALSLKRAKYYLSRLKKSITQKKTNRINDINLYRWKERSDIITDSLWILEKRDNTGVHRADYWGNFIPQIPNQIIKRYTKKGDWILDPFAGCGTTLIESQRLGRNCIGIEINKKICDTANDLITKEPNKHNTINEVLQGDSTIIDFKNILSPHKRKSVQLLIMHPPYFDIIRFSNNPKDLSNSKSVDDFLEKMKKVVISTHKVLDKGRYFALVIGDKYSKGQWIPLGFLTMQEIQKQGFDLKSIIIKNFSQTTAKRNQEELWRYRALVGGFYIFKHEYIFLFKKG